MMGVVQMLKESKIVWIYPSKNINCCLRLYEIDVGLCLKNYTKKANFYLQSLKNSTPKQRYGHEVVGQNKMKEVVKELLCSAKIDCYFTNHLLRRSGGSRLFQAGVEQKLVKELTGHRSDAIDCYQITSECQRQKFSGRIAGESNGNEKSTKESEVNVMKFKQNSLLR